jgi:hypothetical protein
MSGLRVVPAPCSIWLADVPFGCLQQALKNLGQACARYKARFPTFKKRGRSDSFRYSGLSDLQLDQDEQPDLFTGARLAALPQQPQCLGSVDECYCQQCGRGMVCIHPDGTAGRTPYCARGRFWIRGGSSSDAAGIQAAMERWTAHYRVSTEHEHHLPALPAYREGEPTQLNSSVQRAGSGNTRTWSVRSTY